MKKALYTFLAFSASLFFWSCGSAPTSDNKSLSRLDSVEIFNILLNQKDIKSGSIGKDTIKEFITAYKRAYNSGVRIVVDEVNQNAKGFYVDNKIIEYIRDPKNQNMDGLYLYLAKKEFSGSAHPKFDGKITVIAIPAIRAITDPTKDSLLTLSALEWHGHISNRKVINEQEIGY